MTDYLLFVDTEASGLPKDWGKPYSVEGNWPYCVQVAWIIYTNKGELLKLENHFINESDFKISKSAERIHGITHQFLKVNGAPRKEVMQMLAADVVQYQPMVIGHFMQFDFNVLGAEFYRTGIENPIKKEMTFCTMIATTGMIKNPAGKYLRLGELYKALFNSELYNQHNALVDATATADCFFELVKQGEVDDETLAFQQKGGDVVRPDEKANSKGCLIPVLFIIFLTFLIFYYL